MKQYITYISFIILLICMFINILVAFDLLKMSNIMLFLVEILELLDVAFIISIFEVLLKKIGGDENE